MASGLLSLKWNNHRTTFFHVLSTIRSKESYCDVTLACDGKFYPVHKLVLSTCSDYFEQMFERTNCKHPIIVLKDIRHEDLEALLNYMYLGEVNVLQNELAGLIKAAECLMIKGLAVPDEAPTKETKRSVGIVKDDSPVAKKRRKDDEGRVSLPANQHVQREPRESSTGSTPSQRHSASASIPPPTPTVSRTAPPPISPSPSNVSDAVSEEASQGQTEGNDVSAQSNAQEKHGGNERASSQSQPVPEVILDEPGVKEEPEEVDEEMTDTKEILESQFQFEQFGEDSRGDPGGGGGSSGGSAAGFDPQMMTSQPQSMEELVAQAIPGSSGLQGNSLWEGDGSMHGFPMEGYSGDGSRPPQMGKGRGDKDTTGSGRWLHHTYRITSTSHSPHPLHFLEGSGDDGTERVLKKEEDSSHPDAHPSMRSLAPLNLQMYSVSGPGPGHACFLCGKTFGLKHNLYRHLRTHTGERPHQCPHCDYRGSRRSHVMTHINRVHLKPDQPEKTNAPEAASVPLSTSQPT